MRKIHIIGGGTTVPIRPHLSISAPAYGGVAGVIYTKLQGTMLSSGVMHDLRFHLSKMAGGEAFDTNDDLRKLLLAIRDENPEEPCIVIMPAAVCDFEPDPTFESGKDLSRLKTSEGGFDLPLRPSEKLIRILRGNGVPGARKNIFLVAFKATTGASDDEMFIAGLTLLKDASANLVFVNDLHRRTCMIVTPEQSRYASAAEDARTARFETLDMLIDMTLSRTLGKFTRSQVIQGEPVPWESAEVHSALREVVNHCISRGAYKDLLGRGATVGHFAQKVSDTSFLTSRRSSDFNRMAEVGLVRVDSAGADDVVAHGFRPSVGGQSQRIIFAEHQEVDCIVHFHCPPKPGAPTLPKRLQWPNECGSHECGQATSRGLQEIEEGIKVVYLDKHGPNIVFNHSIDPQRVIQFIDRTFDLSRHTGEGDFA